MSEQRGAAQDSGLLLAIYATITSDDAFPTMLRLLAARFGCHSAALVYVDPLWNNATITVAHGPFADKGVQDRYIDKFATLDPVPGEMARLAPGDVLSSDHLFTGPQLAPHSYFLENFYYPLGLGGALGGPLANRKGQIGLVAIHRSLDRARFDQADIEAFRRLMPHIIQAIELRRAFYEIDAYAGQIEDGLASLKVGVLAFKPDGALQHANSFARSLLARADGLSLDRQGRLRTADPKLDRALQAALRQETPVRQSSMLIIRRPGDGRPAYLLRVAHPENRTRGARVTGPIVVVSDPDRPADDPEPLLRMAFGLSRDSARLVASLMAGNDISTYAERTGISINTAKYHLKAAFQATGARRQVDLVRLAVVLTRDV